MTTQASPANTGYRLDPNTGLPVPAMYDISILGAMVV